MNALRIDRKTPSNPADTLSDRVAAAPSPVRHIHRERDFGVGYGNSSGYASDRCYAADWAQPRFRCA